VRAGRCGRPWGPSRKVACFWIHESLGEGIRESRMIHLRLAAEEIEAHTYYIASFID
jgi:hypothetical protein